VTQSLNGTWTEALLHRIAVRPPTIAKTVGTRSVGWRFIVDRSLDRENTPWVVAYRSPLQRGSSSADLTPMRVNVTVPADADTPNGQRFVWYRVIIKLFWYRSDGSVQMKVTHLMDDMHLIVAGDDLIDSYCPGLAEQFIDGA
jgi:hypothetical protein